MRWRGERERRDRGEIEERWRRDRGETEERRRGEIEERRRRDGEEVQDRRKIGGGYGYRGCKFLFKLFGDKGVENYTTN